MESEFEKKLKDVQPRRLSDDEKEYLWSNIKEGVAVEGYIQAHKRSRFEAFNIFKYFGEFGHARQFRFAAIAAVIALVMGSSFSTVALADHSLPGDFLYPLNRAVENVRIQLAAADHKDELRIEFASKRLEEVKALLERANIAYNVLAEESSSTASSTNSTDNTNDTGTQTADNTDSTTQTAGNTDNASSTEVAGTSDNTASSTDTAQPQYYTSKTLDTAVLQANNAFVIALDYLNQTRDQMIADGNDVGLAAVEAFIAELTALADNHVNDIERSKVAIETNKNDSQKVSIAIQTSTDNVKTKFNFNQTTDKDGDTSNKIALQTGTSSKILKTNGDQTSYTTTTNSTNGGNNNGYRSDFYKNYQPPSISVCYKNNSQDVKPDELAGYFRKGARLGACKDNSHGQDKIDICHNGKTITVAKPSEWAHLSHGDTEGACGSGHDHDGDDDHDNDHNGNNGDTTPPVISSVSAAPGTTTATITWQTNEQTKTTLWYGTTTAIDTSGAHKDDTSLRSSHSLALTGLSTSTTYYFRIDATDGSGNTATSSVTSFTTGSGADETAPVISGISVDATTTEATAHWTTNENTTGVIWYGTTSPLVLSSSSHVADGTSGTSHSVNMPSLTSDTTYHYLIVATDGSGNTATSSEGSFTTASLPDTTAPQVSDLSSDSSTSSATVTFTTDEPAKSTLWYSTTSPVPIGSPSMTYPGSGYATSHTFSFSSLTPETTYYFRIEVIDETGNSRLISESNFTTLALPDVTAPVISAVHTENEASASADVVFTTDEDAIGTVWYGTTTPLVVDGSTPFTKEVSAGTGHTLSLSGLTASTTYYFIVGAADGSNNTSTSSESSFATP